MQTKIICPMEPQGLVSMVKVVDHQTQGYYKQMFSCNCSGNLAYHATLSLL